MRTPTALAALALVATAALAAPGGGSDPAVGRATTAASTASTASTASARPPAVDLAARTPRADAATTQVLAISIDGLTPRAITRLGATGAPHLTRLLREGASTVRARTQWESTSTLPNHTSMVTGRRVWDWKGGHGILWNDHRPGSRVQQYADDLPIPSVFTGASAAGSTALFTSKQKFSLFKRSWRADLDRYVHRETDDVALTTQVLADLARTPRAFRFVHLSRPDTRGHTYGFMSPEYLDGVAEANAQVGRMLAALESDADLADTIVVLTADHGGGRGLNVHDQVGRRPNFEIPFVVWGPGVRAGDLYAMNPTYRSPGTRRVGYAGKQPIRNGDLANLTLDLLGLGPLPGSRYDVRQRLTWR